ncbi:hypothetical protein pneo_cds_746 [Pandoravirus neocaledonia]|uniref:Uncharacterized protein n=1 Tax=Pandoravirus neocaledonia TaxID=2107708 RepID=A0A2U7UD41_9VIRU|nr:hypothetical protein pneo_cds_746 [Pandoravirus neocaledonia]AVK76353.1 hypothetical protein pneo_cds_746 [Pandoravirus neocaledonia]
MPTELLCGIFDRIGIGQMPVVARLRGVRVGRRATIDGINPASTPARVWDPCGGHARHTTTTCLWLVD